jgi:hypothetical protein
VYMQEKGRGEKVEVGIVSRVLVAPSCLPLKVCWSEGKATGNEQGKALGTYFLFRNANLTESVQTLT